MKFCFLCLTKEIRNCFQLLFSIFYQKTVFAIKFWICTNASSKSLDLLSETNPTYSELYLYFTHNFMASFQEMLLLVEKHTTVAYNLHNIMIKFSNTILKKATNILT